MGLIEYITSSAIPTELSVYGNFPYLAMSGEKDRTTHRRALLTNREREIIAGEGSDNESQRYQAVSRIRRKIQNELPRDMKILRSNHPQLFAELQEVVNDDDIPPSPEVGSDPWAACVAISPEGYHDCEDVAPVMTALTDRKWDRSGASKVLSAIFRDGYANRREIEDRASRSHSARYEYSLENGVRLNL